MRSQQFQYSTFIITEEGVNFVARDRCEADDGAFLELQADSLDTLITGIKMVEAVGSEPIDPVTNRFPNVPPWYEPYLYEGDVSRIVLKSNNLHRLFGVTPRAARVANLLCASFAFAIWAVVSISAHPTLAGIGISARGLL